MKHIEYIIIITVYGENKDIKLLQNLPQMTPQNLGVNT